MASRVVEIVEMIDWYDGVVMAIARPSWRSGLFVMSLVSWDFDTRRRIFALLPITESDALGLSTRPDDEGEAMVQLAKLGARVDGDVFLILCDEHPPSVLAEATVGIDDVRDELFGDVQQALDVGRQRWFAWSGWNL